MCEEAKKLEGQRDALLADLETEVRYEHWSSAERKVLKSVLKWARLAFEVGDAYEVNVEGYSPIEIYGDQPELSSGFLEEHLICEETDCSLRRECANHGSAGDFRSEGGTTPDAKFIAGVWMCRKIKKGSKRGSLFLKSNGRYGVYDGPSDY